MPWTDPIWRRLLEDGFLDDESAARARARYEAEGGAPDTAILETTPLTAGQRSQLRLALAAACDSVDAPPNALDERDPSAMEAVPRELVIEHAILPVWMTDDCLTVVTPPIDPNVLSELSFQVGRPVDTRLALEVEIRCALARHIDEPLPERFIELEHPEPETRPAPAGKAGTGRTTLQGFPKVDTGAGAPLDDAAKTQELPRKARAPAAPSGETLAGMPVVSGGATAKPRVEVASTAPMVLAELAQALTTAAAASSPRPATPEPERAPPPNDGPRYGRAADRPVVTAVRHAAAEPATEMGMPAVLLEEMRKAAAETDEAEPPPTIKITRTPVPGIEETATAPVAPRPERADPDRVADLRPHVAALDSDDMGASRAAEEGLLDGGVAAVEALMETFPGRLLVDRYARAAGTEPVESHSHLLRVLVRLGEPAARALSARLDHLSPETRYYAAFAFTAVHAPWALARLAEGAWDSDASVREMTAYVLATYRDERGYDAALERLRAAVSGEPARRRRPAVEMLGHLREARALPALVEALQQNAGGLSDAAHRALVEIALHDFGRDAWMWEAWYERNQDRPRVEWLFDGMLSDQRHIRLLAFNELRDLTHQNPGYSADAPPADRRAAVNRWRTWWEATGRARYSAYRG